MRPVNRRKFHYATTAAPAPVQPVSAATSNKWAIPDKIFGYLNQLTSDFYRIQYSSQATTPGTPAYIAAQQQALLQNRGMFGLQKPWGGVLLIVGAGLVVYGIYKVAS